jgi:hypothetical protein
MQNIYRYRIKNNGRLLNCILSRDSYFSFHIELFNTSFAQQTDKDASKDRSISISDAKSIYESESITIICCNIYHILPNEAVH